MRKVEQKMKKTIFEEMGGTYVRCGDYFIPNLTLPEEEEPRFVGVWGQRHLQYLKEYRRNVYLDLMMSGRLNSYLVDIEEQAQERLNVMIHTSEHPLSHLFRGMTLSPIFPTEKDKIVYERHDIDKILLEYINELKCKKGYKLLNQLESEVFVSSLHERYKMNTESALSMFIKEEDLYNAVRAETKIKLLPYFNTISVAMVTQLFPVLEVKIRELVTLFGIFPFKKNIDEFMQYNDPSSLLRELLTMIFDEQHSFENVPDLIFIYNIMYNGNSCNVRNECIHGRDYLSGGRLRFAFRATLFAIHMVEFRINTIKENISDIMEI